MSLVRSLSRPLTRGLTRNLNGADEDIVYNLTTALPSGATFTRASSAQRINASKVTATETTNAPCFDFNWQTGAARGLYLRPATRLLNLQSGRVDNATFTKNGFLTPSAPVTGLDGTASAYRLAETSATANRYCETAQVAILGGETTATVKAFVKATGSARIVQLYVYYNSGTFPGRGVCFDLAALTVGTAYQINATGFTHIAASIVDLGDGWRELTLTVGKGANVSLKAGIGLALTDTSTNVPSYLGDGASGIFVAHQGVYASADAGIIQSTTGTITQAVESLTLPIPDGIWDITTKDTLGSSTARVSVVGGYTVTPRSGQVRVTSVRAVFVASYTGFDADAKTWLHANQITHVAGRRSVDATFKAIKADATLTYADIAFAGFAPGRNKDAGTTVKMAGGWSAALIDGVLSSEARMRTGDPYGLYTNNGTTGGTITRIDFASVPLGTTYAIGMIAAPKGNPSAARALFAVGGSTAALRQVGSYSLVLNADAPSPSLRGIRVGRANRLSFIQEASSVGRALGELGYNRTTSLNVTGTQTVYLGTQAISGAVGNTEEGGAPEVILEAAYWMKNPSEAKVAALTTILRDNLCVIPPGSINGFILTGQSSASLIASSLLDQIIATDADYGRNFVQQFFQHTNQPIAQWVGAAAPYARAGFYNDDLLPSGGNWKSVLDAESLPTTTSGLIWFQGVADMGYAQGLADGPAEAVAALYEAKLAALVAFLRTDYPDLPLVIMQSDWEDTAGHTLTASEISRIATVRAAQAAVVAANTHIALVDTRGLARDPADGVHLTNAGAYAAMSAAWAAMKALL